MSVNNHLLRLAFGFYEKSRFCYRKIVWNYFRCWDLLPYSASEILSSDFHTRYFWSTFSLVLHLGFFQKVNDVTIFFPLENKFLSNTSNWKPKNILLEFKPQNSKLSFFKYLIATLEMSLINNVFCIFISAALRFLRRVISLKDEFYYRFIKVEKLLKPVVDAFKTNGSRYNLLNSAIIDLFEFIKTVCGFVIFACFQNCQDSTTCRWY